jgi:hypothetical protein
MHVRYLLTYFLLKYLFRGDIQAVGMWCLAEGEPTVVCLGRSIPQAEFGCIP